MDNIERKTEDKVMGMIKGGKVKLHSRYLFLAEKLGMGSAITLSVLLAMLFFNLLLFYLKESDNLSYLRFGFSGAYAFWESFPYLLVVFFILFVFLAGYVLKRSGFSYDRPFGLIALALTCLIFVTGAIVTFTSLNDRLERATFESDAGLPFMKPFFHGGLGGCCSGVSGKVVRIELPDLLVWTPRGEQLVNVAAIDLDRQHELLQGEFYIFLGNLDRAIFIANDFRLVKSAEMPLIKRHIRRRFNAPTPPSFEPDFQY